MKNFKHLAMVWMVVLSFCGAALAQEVEESRGEYDFNWLDPDKKIYVLQNRKYTKADRILFSGSIGLGTSNAYRKTTNFDFRMNYGFSEEIAIEGFYQATKNRANGTYEALEAASPTALPVIREIRSQIGLLTQWSPWYAKINVFNTVFYFDWYFSGGVGVINTALDENTVAGGASQFVDESFFAFYLGTGHQYHISKNFIIRLDFMGAFYRAPLFGNTGDQSWFTNFNFNFGVGYRI